MVGLIKGQLSGSGPWAISNTSLRLCAVNQKLKMDYRRRPALKVRSSFAARRVSPLLHHVPLAIPTLAIAVFLHSGQHPEYYEIRYLRIATKRIAHYPGQRSLLHHPGQTLP